MPSRGESSFSPGTRKGFPPSGFTKIWWPSLGAAGTSYDSVRRLLKRLGAVRPLPMRRMECEAGQEAQVDFGTGARIKTPEGKRRKTHVLRVVLSHSRKAYSEACFRQTAEDFLRVLENAFWHFGGVPKTVVVDNLKAAVLRPDWFDPGFESQAAIVRPALRHGDSADQAADAASQGQGRARRGLRARQQPESARVPVAGGREPASGHWEQNIADTRIHGTTKRHVGKVFREVEQAALLPLPAERFPFFHEAQRIVSRDGHIEVAKAYYSVPPEYLGRTVWARWDERLVRVFNHRLEQIALHVRREPGKFSTLGEHIVPEKISGVERGAAWLLRKIEVLGEQAHAWAQAMLKTRGIEGVRVLQGLLSLSTRHPCEAIDEACGTALSYGAFRLQTLRQLSSDAPRPTTASVSRRAPDHSSHVRLRRLVPRRPERLPGVEPAGPPGSSPEPPTSFPSSLIRVY